MADDEQETYKLWRIRKTVMQVIIGPRYCAICQCDLIVNPLEHVLWAIIGVSTYSSPSSSYDNDFSDALHMRSIMHCFLVGIPHHLMYVKLHLTRAKYEVNYRSNNHFVIDYSNPNLS